MCGIAGQFSVDLIERKAAEDMARKVRHRGPDDRGFYFEKKLFLANQRLSIVDLSSAGHQPMWNYDNTIGIVFNGEIYNFQEIKKNLSEFSFCSKSDTEVVLYAYQKWGFEEMVEKLNGMFSFCIYDKRAGKAFLVRDRIGIKPLVYYWDKENFLFASELKALLASGVVKRDINPKAVLDFFMYRYVPHPRTIFKNVYKLEPGHFLEVDLNSFTLKKQQYWTLQAERSLEMQENEIVEQVEFLLEDAVRLRLIADTEVATFLSGGIDSSLVTTLAKHQNKNIRAFCIDLQPSKYSEATYAALLAQSNGIDLQIGSVGKDEFERAFDTIVSFYDEPFADSSMVPTYLLAQYVRESGLKCVLSGDGGDELFYGYSWYEHFDSFHIRNLFLFLLSGNSLERYRRLVYDRFTVKEVNRLFDFDFQLDNAYLYQEVLGKDSVRSEELNFLDFHTFLVDDILYKVDIASMANSLEVRVPFLDHRLVELMYAIPFQKLIKNKERKYLLKKIARQHIPQAIVERKKQGFSAPVMNWIGKNFREELIGGELVSHGFISRKRMQEFVVGERNKGKLWQMYAFERWYRMYGTDH